MQLGEQSGYLEGWRVGGAREEQEDLHNHRRNRTILKNRLSSLLFVGVGKLSMASNFFFNWPHLPLTNLLPKVSNYGLLELTLGQV